MTTPKYYREEFLLQICGRVYLEAGTSGIVQSGNDYTEPCEESGEKGETGESGEKGERETWN